MVLSTSEDMQVLPEHPEQLRQLHLLTRALSRAEHAGDVRAVIATDARVLLGAAEAWWITFEDSSPSDFVDESLIVRDAACSGVPQFFESRRELVRACPALMQAHVHGAAHALAALPMVSDGGVVGAVGFSFSSPRGFDDDDRAFLTVLAHETGQALVRAHAMARLRAAVAAHDRALAMIGHDLRDPVNAIALIMQRLEEDADRGVASREVVRAAGSRIATAVARIMRIIGELVDDDCAESPG